MPHWRSKQRDPKGSRPSDKPPTKRLQGWTCPGEASTVSPAKPRSENRLSGSRTRRMHCGLARADRQTDRHLQPIKPKLI